MKFDPSNIILNLAVASKRALFNSLSSLGAENLGIPAGSIGSALLTREQLGSTNCGNGIALPHAFVEGISMPYVSLVRLRPSLPYCPDPAQYVDLVCLLLAPSSLFMRAIILLGHLKAVLMAPETADFIRQAKTAEAICEYLNQRLTISTAA